MNSNVTLAPPACTRAVAPLTGHRLVYRNRNLDDLVAGRGQGLAGQAVAFDADRHRLGDAGNGDPGQLQRRLRRPDEQLRRLRQNQPHLRTLRRVCRT